MLDLEAYRVGRHLPSIYYIPEAIGREEEARLLREIRASKQAWKTVSGRRLQNLGGVVHQKGLIAAPLPSWLQPLLARLAGELGIFGEGGALPNHVLINAYEPGEGIMPHEDGPLYHPAVAILSLGHPAVVRFARKRGGGGDAAAAGGAGAAAAPPSQQPDAAPAAEGAEAPRHSVAGQLAASVVCQPRSLLVFRDDAYTDCLHGILEAEVEDIDSSVVNAEAAGVTPGQGLLRGGERVSLTVRRVLRTYKGLGIRLAGGSGCTGGDPPALAAAGAAAVQAAAGLDDLVEAVDTFKDLVGSHGRELEHLWRGRLERLPEQGIVCAAGSPYTLANAFVSLHVLRHHLRCKLPATVMYWGRVAGDVPSPETMQFMQEHISDLSFVDASALPWPAWHRAFSDDLDSWKYEDGWKLKAFVLYAAPYKHVMFLDADATPALDPTVLFDHPQYHQSGSMYWPDMWRGSPDLFHTLGMPQIGRERQTESGIFLVDRARHWLAVEWALWLNVNERITYKLAYGDKDTFRAAFHLAGTPRAFYQVPHPLGLMLQPAEGGYTNRGFLQAHPNGTSMFIHRVSGAKYDPSSDDPKPITHVTVPSVQYFVDKGWNTGVLPSEHFQPKVWSEDGAEAGPVACPFSMHTLYSAISQGGHVGRALAAADAAFCLLRAAMQNAAAGSALFQLQQPRDDGSSSLGR